MKRVIVALMAAALLLAGTACSPAGETEPSSQEVSSSSSSSASPVPQEEGHGVAEHGAAARYYEYLKDHSEVCLLLSPEGQPFTDEQLSAYALWGSGGRPMKRGTGLKPAFPRGDERRRREVHRPHHPRV